ncbi:hypothetical protein K492DRAFT_175089, partial [Lichtheimia hyalospora FSU 10163]
MPNPFICCLSQYQSISSIMLDRFKLDCAVVNLCVFLCIKADGLLGTFSLYSAPIFSRNDLHLEENFFQLFIAFFFRNLVPVLGSCEGLVLWSSGRHGSSRA